MKYSHVAQYITGTPWAILPEKLELITDLVSLKMAGGSISEAEIAELKAANGTAARGARSGAVAVLPLLGVIHARANIMLETSGGTSIERFGAMFRQAVAMPDVAAIVLDVDSPGGAVPGVDELAAEIFKARGRKPIVAMINNMGASAAYWIATAAPEVVVTPSGEVGSIGVFAAHLDISAMQAAAGVKTTLISAGNFKTEGNPYEPLTDEARGAIQERVDDYYDMFVSRVARNRGVGVADVRGGFGQGRMIGAGEAVRLGMADRVATMAETLTRLGAPVAVQTISAEADWADGVMADKNNEWDRRKRRFKLLTY